MKESKRQKRTETKEEEKEKTKDRKRKGKCGRGVVGEKWTFWSYGMSG